MTEKANNKNNLLSLYNICINDNDLQNREFLLNLVDKLDNIIVDKKYIDNEHIERLTVYRSRYYHKLEILDKKSPKVIDNNEEINIKPLNICTFYDTLKEYFILVHMPNVTEDNLVPELLVVCHTNENDKMMLTPLSATRIGSLYNDLVILTRTIQRGHWKCCKLGNDKSIFSIEIEKILEIGTIINNNKKEIIKELYTDISDNDISVYEEDYIRYKYLFSTLNWTTFGIPGKVKDKLNKWTNKKLIFDSKNITIKRSNGKVNLSFENYKIAEDYINVIPTTISSEECQINNINEEIWIKIVNNNYKYPSYTKDISIFNKPINKPIKNDINYKYDKKCPNMMDHFGCIMTKCKFRHPIGWECRVKRTVNNIDYDYKNNGVLRLEAKNAKRRQDFKYRKMCVYIEELKKYYNNISEIDQVAWCNDKTKLINFSKTKVNDYSRLHFRLEYIIEK